MVVLVDAGEPGESGVVGRGPHQAPEVDGNVRIVGSSPTSAAGPELGLAPGDLVHCVITGSHGIDLIAQATGVVEHQVPAAVNTAPMNTAAMSTGAMKTAAMRTAAMKTAS